MNRSIVPYRTGSRAGAMLYIHHKLGPDNPMRQWLPSRDAFNVMDEKIQSAS